MRLDQVIDHPHLFKNYPELKSIVVNVQKLPHDSNDLLRSASWDTGRGKMSLNIPVAINGSADSNVIAKHVLGYTLHEVQHAIQQIENWPRGSSPTQWDHAAFEVYKKSESARIENDPSFRQALNSFEAMQIKKTPTNPAGPLDWEQLQTARENITQEVRKIAAQLYMDDPGEIQARRTGLRITGEPLPLAPEKNVRDLPYAPSTSLSLAEKVVRGKLVVARQIEIVRERFGINQLQQYAQSSVDHRQEKSASQPPPIPDKQAKSPTSHYKSEPKSSLAQAFMKGRLEGSSGMHVQAQAAKQSSAKKSRSMR
jgi:hypothetical protein